ncbi:hypothetical protein [Anabaena sp. UHCC 0451]|nr:hypothetical protein [Anabaena sp. UHCC 0451]MEA5575586.1 hypothetical protein [Anabaena sp. UHCC 0451]
MQTQQAKESAVNLNDHLYEIVSDRFFPGEPTNEDLMKLYYNFSS